jgi:uncharacterized damage-inducible protein DinB
MLGAYSPSLLTLANDVELFMRTYIVSRWEQVKNKLADLAEVFPENHFRSHLVPDARSCDQVLRHVAFWNRFVAESLRGERPDETANELAAAEYSTRARVIEALKASAQDVTTALTSNNLELDTGSLGQIAMAIEHSCEHYGQLVVYARIIGTTPPASRC